MSDRMLFQSYYSHRPVMGGHTSTEASCVGSEIGYSRPLITLGAHVDLRCGERGTGAYQSPETPQWRVDWPTRQM